MWQEIDRSDYKIQYVDRYVPETRHYGDPRPRFREANDEIVLEPDARQLAIIIWFAEFFIPTFTLLAYFFIPDKGKWIFVAAGPTVGSATFGLFYFMLKQEIDAGPYIKWIAKTNQIVLPRADLTFDKDTVTLQCITGCSQRDRESQTDLNLIAPDENGQLCRCFVAGGSYLKPIKKFAEHVQVPVQQVNMGWNGRRDTDRNTID